MLANGVESENIHLFQVLTASTGNHERVHRRGCDDPRLAHKNEIHHRTEPRSDPSVILRS